MDVCIYMTHRTQIIKNVAVVPNILLRVVVAGTETEENKKDLWKMILEVYGALRKCYTFDTYVTIYLNLF